MEFKFNKRSKKWREIETVKDWIDSFRKSSKSEDGRSALSLAKFCDLKNFDDIIVTWLLPIVSQSQIKLETAQPEKSSRFDNYSKQRIHDLAIYGETGTGCSIFIGIEAKVAETYNGTLSSIYQKAINNKKKGINTYIPQRIKQLIQVYFPKLSIDSKIRYQLLYAIAGTLCEQKDYNILLFLTFKTNKYNPKAAERNKKDLQELLNDVDHETIAEGYYECKINGQKLYIIEKTTVLN